MARSANLSSVHTPLITPRESLFSNHVFSFGNAPPLSSLCLVPCSLLPPKKETQLFSMEGTVVNGEQSALQKHVAFFDRNKDGIVYPSETFQGFRAIGCGVILSTVASLFINMGLSSSTVPKGKKAFPHFPIYVENIHKAKHGSDTGVYDTQGRFVPSKFEDIFCKHAHSKKDSLTSQELNEMLKANRTPKDKAGRLASWTEWKILFFLCKDKHGLLHKDTVRAVYDGSLFEKMEKERASRRKN